MKASRGSSRSGTAASTRPGGSSAGMSFSEWMAQSMRPSSRASSISLVNRPLPPISISRRSWMRSPLVTIGISWAKASMSSPGRPPRAAAIRACIRPDWASDSLEPRAPIRMGCRDKVGTLPARSKDALLLQERRKPATRMTPLRKMGLTILGLETSCDETAASVVRRDEDGRVEVLSSIVGTQFEQHAPFGGVVPEIAARAHVEAIDAVAAEAMRAAA
jgi:hypothetical protein